MNVADQERQAEERRRESVKVDTGVLAFSLAALAVCVGGSLYSMMETSGKLRSDRSPGNAEVPLSITYLVGLVIFALPAVGLSLEVTLATMFWGSIGVTILSLVMVWLSER